jgi:hypothetical protein
MVQNPKIAQATVKTVHRKFSIVAKNDFVSRESRGISLVVPVGPNDPSNEICIRKKPSNDHQIYSIKISLTRSVSFQHVATVGTAAYTGPTRSTVSPRAFK